MTRGEKLMATGLLLDIDQDEVHRIVIPVLQVLDRLEARGPEAYVALIKVASTLMLGLDELPDNRTINHVLGRLYPVWARLLSEQGKGTSVH